MCTIPINMIIVVGLHKFTPQATIDHRGPSIHSGHYTRSINCGKKRNKTFYCNDINITEFEMVDTKNFSTAYVVTYTLIT